LQTIPVPEPTGTDILVKVGAASFCHTDALALDVHGPFVNHAPDRMKAQGQLQN
jgi:NADPH:quinone reductase-like Zn-dependent oxidoreductase